MISGEAVTCLHITPYITFHVLTPQCCVISGEAVTCLHITPYITFHVLTPQCCVISGEAVTCLHITLLYYLSCTYSSVLCD